MGSETPPYLSCGSRKVVLLAIRSNHGRKLQLASTLKINSPPRTTKKLPIPVPSVKNKVPKFLVERKPMVGEATCGTDRKPKVV
jgi:hypothetical protein